MKSIQLKKPVKLGGQEWGIGDLIEVEDAIAADLCAGDDPSAVEKTLHQYQDEYRAELAAKAKADTDAKAKARETVIVTRVANQLARDPRGGYLYFSEFAKDVSRACRPGVAMPPKLAAWAKAAAELEGEMASVGKHYMNEGDDEQGGFLVPTEFRNQLLMTTLENELVWPRTMQLPMQTNSLAIPAVTDLTHAGNTFYGGVTIYRTGESQYKYNSKPALARVQLTLHKLTGLVLVTDELLEDSPISLEPLLTQMFGSAIAFVRDDDCINGTGVNMALGAAVAANPSLIQVPRQIVGRVSGVDLMNMWPRLYSAGRSRAIWIYNTDVLPDLMRAVWIPAGTAIPIPLYIPPGGASATPYASIFGRPAYDTEKCQTCGVMGDILLADWSQYVTGQKAAGGGVQTASSIHLYFEYDITAFRFVLRYDGQPWWAGQQTPAHSAMTVSPFVVLSDTDILTTTTAHATTTGMTTAAPTTSPALTTTDAPATTTTR